MVIGGVVLKAGIDSQASVNIMDSASFNRLRKETSAPSTSLRESSTPVFGYNAKAPLPVIGEIKARVSVGNAQVTTKFSVVEGSAGNLLSFGTSSELRLIEITNNVSVTNNTDDMIASYDDLFNGIGKVKNDT
ncbi:uncharacterized protein [Amphiura filiformis]|uniref:uncharacterized protein n=1 Tax=Amphiura filiformis TaxID=82378 RepID=UPI003B2111AB